MKKNSLPLPFKLLLGIIVGGAIGLFCRANIQSTAGLMQVLICLHRLMGQFIMFCVPLIILGFIMPSITTLGDNAGKFLGIALLLAYLSSVFAATLSAVVGYLVVPMLHIARPENATALPDAIFKLDIPQIMPVITALFLSITVGLAVVWNRAQTWKSLLAEFQVMVLSIVEKCVIPILPFYIGTTFVTLGFEGTLSQFPVFLIAILIVLVGHFIWMAVLYGLAGAYSGKSPVEVFKHYGPAYITAVGTMSSAATLSVALECARKSKALRKDLVNFGIPLFANIHLCGSVLTETFFVMIISQILYGRLPAPGTMVLFIVLLGVFAVGAPGVPGGTVVASLGLVTGVLGFDETGAALVLAIFALQDSFGTACNVTSDGALTLFLTGYAERHHIMEAGEKKVKLVAAKAGAAAVKATKKVAGAVKRAVKNRKK
jgi:Na+/H+-dicarboxylate symporter